MPKLRERQACRRVARFTLTIIVIGLGIPAGVRACDLCSIYTATLAQQSKTGPWIALAQQFTSFNTLRNGSDTIHNEAGEWLQSSITQLVVGATMHPRFALQIGVPIIARSFRRLHDGEIRRGNTNGIGDISALGHFKAFEHVSDDSVTRIGLFAGLKMPTGNSHYLGEEMEMAPMSEAKRATESGNASVLHTRGATSHHEGGGTEQSGVHGHDLALGSGSFDGVFGLTLFTNWKRLFFEGGLQYLARGDGDHEYQFADELLWDAGPGAFMALAERYSAALQAVLSGETKGKDTQAGERLDDTAVTALYMGPRVIGTYGEWMHADFGVEWPLLQNVTAVQIVPDWRLQAGLTWRF